MAMNKVKQGSQMYPWVNATWNVIKGKCPHDCSYCYMKRYPQPQLHFDPSEIKTKLGSGKTIFVGSSCDAWAESIPDIWIKSMLIQCAESTGNKYLFQSKNPIRFREYSGYYPTDFMLGTTIESNYNLLNGSLAPNVYERMKAMSGINHLIPKMVSIEPIITFDLDTLIEWIKNISPKFVSIGADSGNNYLPEPSGDKVKALIEGLREITEVKIKDNLKRLTEK